MEIDKVFVIIRAISKIDQEIDAKCECIGEQSSKRIYKVRLLFTSAKIECDL